MSGAATTTSSTTCWPARSSATGLTGVFTFGAVARRHGRTGCRRPTCCCSASARASIAAMGAVLRRSARRPHRLQAVIVGSLAAMIVVGVVLLNLSGAVAFWVCGLLLCLFIGPTQSSARTMMLRMSIGGQGRRGVRALHDDRPGRVVPRAAAVLHLHRRVRHATARAWAGLVTVLVLGLVAISRRARARQVRASASPSAVHNVRPVPVFCWVSVPSMVIEQVSSAADVDDADARRAVGRTGELNFLRPRQHDVELGLQHAAAVEVQDADGAALARDRVDDGVGVARGRSESAAASCLAWSAAASWSRVARGGGRRRASSTVWSRSARWASAVARRRCPAASC